MAGFRGNYCISPSANNRVAFQPRSDSSRISLDSRWRDGKSREEVGEKRENRTTDYLRGGQRVAVPSAARRDLRHGRRARAVRAVAGAGGDRGCSPRRVTRSRHEEFRSFLGMGEDRFLGGVAEARRIPLDPARDKARTYALYLDVIKGQLTALPGVRDFVADCRRAGAGTGGRVERRRGQGQRATSTRSAFPPRPSTSWSTAPRWRGRSPPPTSSSKPAAASASSRRPAWSSRTRSPGSPPRGRRLPLPRRHHLVPRRKARRAGADWVAPGLDHVPPTVLDW